MCDDLQKCCRICLNVNYSNHVSILGDPTINLHIRSCLTITISPNDHLSKAICMSCVSQLSQYYNFQLNARCSQDWLESSMQELMKKSLETKNPVQPLPDSEYNSDSLLEFLNNTANIEEYLNNLGKEDIPSIVNMLDRNEQSVEVGKLVNLKTKIPSPKKKEKSRNCNSKMEIDVLDSDVEIVKEIIKKKTELNTANYKIDKNFLTCYGCVMKFDTIQKLSQHLSTCDNASRTCIHCHELFDSKHKMQQHSITHNTMLPLSCNCGEKFQTKERLIKHYKICHSDNGIAIGCLYRCKECGDTFKDRFLLYKHARDHIIKAEQRVCSVCGHRFTGDEALNRHKSLVHEKPENLLYRCKICNQTSADRNKMYLHVKKHTDTPLPSPNRHLCESCGCSFATKASMYRHLLLHGYNKNKCNVCSAYFRSEKELVRHSLEHVEMVMCERCGETFVNYDLNEHKCM